MSTVYLIRIAADAGRIAAVSNRDAGEGLPPHDGRPLTLPVAWARAVRRTVAGSEVHPTI